MQLELVAGPNITLVIIPATDSTPPQLAIGTNFSGTSMQGYDSSDYPTLADVPVPQIFPQIYEDTNGSLWYLKKNSTIWVLINTPG